MLSPLLPVKTRPLSAPPLECKSNVNPSRLLRPYMDILLWIGNCNSCLIEGLFHSVSEIPIDGPVVGCLCPRPAYEIHGTGGEFVDADEWLGVCQDQRMCLHGLFDDA